MIKPKFDRNLFFKLMCALWFGAALAACTRDPEPANDLARASSPAAVAANQKGNSNPATEWLSRDPAILRVRTDTERGRAWVLTRDGVDFYRLDTREKIAHITLPGWQWADEPYVCAPDLAIGMRGVAAVTSNVTSTIWRIDPETLAVSREEPEVENPSGREIGFTGLVYDNDQAAYFAVSELHGALWRIDSRFKRAQRVELSAPFPKTCGIEILSRRSAQRSSHFGALCVQAAGIDWVVNLSRDRTAGDVRPGRCSGDASSRPGQAAVTP